MDEKDRMILQLLEENSRIPVEKIKELVNLEAEEIEIRIHVMEEAGVIRKYTTLIDNERIGDGSVSAVIMLKVSPERDSGYDKIAARLARFREVRSLRLMTGTYDLQLTVTARTMRDVAQFVAEEIAPMDHIRETATHIIMKSYKENGTLLFELDEVDRLPYSL